MNKFCQLLFLLSIIFLSVNVFADENTVRVGWFESPHFQEGMSDSEPKSGYAYEYLEKISDYTGWKYEYVYGGWNELLKKLEKGEIDVLGGVSYTKERENYMLFPAIAMGTDNYAIVQRTDRQVIDANNPSSLSGKKIGYVRNNRMSVYAEQWLKKNNINNIEPVYFDAFTERDKALSAGLVDAVTATTNNIRPNSGYELVAKVGEEPFYLAVAKNRQDILNELDPVLRVILHTSPNYLDALQIKCYGTTLDDIGIVGEEKKWLSEHKEIRIGYVKNYLPFCDQNERGQPTGLVKDLVQHLISSIGLEKQVSFKYKVYNSFIDMAYAIHNNEIDMAFPVMADRRYLSDADISGSLDVISVPFYVAYKGAFSNKTFDVIALNNRPIKEIEDNHSESAIFKTKTSEECLDAIVEGKATCTIMASYRLRTLLNNPKYRSIRILPFEASFNYCIGVNKDSPELLRLVNKSISLSDKGKLVDAVYRYIQQGEKFTVADFVRENFPLVLLIGSVFFFIIITCLGFGLFMLKKSKEQLQENLEKTNIIAALSTGYDAIHLADLDAETFTTIQESEGIKEHNFETKTSPYTTMTRAMVDAFVQPDDKEEFLKFLEIDNLKKKMQTEKTFSYRYANVPDSTGKYMFEMNFVRIGDNPLRHFLVIGAKCIDDILKIERDLKNALNAAEAANKAKTTFLNNMSHDIRTPMNAICGYTELLEKSLDDKEKAENYLEKIKSSSKFLLSLINNVLEMARIETGHATLDEEFHKIGDLSAELKAIFTERMAQKHIEYNFVLENKTKYVFIDKVKLNEIYLNLLSNAYKYTPSNGTVDFSIREIPSDRPGYARFKTVVSDSGIGMADDYIPHIFEAFTREKSTTDSKIEGTGLGMPIVKKLVELMGGTISVESKLGKGTTFTVILDHRIAEEAKVSKDDKKQADYSMLKGKQILLAEDNDFNAEIATIVLNNAGLKVDRVADGIQCIDALEKSAEGYFDLILMDVQMPNMNGYTATKRIRKMEDPAKSRIPIIAMTANAFEEDKKLALEAGMDGHVSKPIDVDSLMETLSNFLK